MRAIRSLENVGWRLGEVESFELRAKTECPQEAIEAYKRDGVVCFRQAFDGYWLDEIEKGIEDVYAMGGANADVIQADPNDPGFFYNDTVMWPRVARFKDFIYNSNAPDLYRSLLETESLTFYYDFLIVKNAGCNTSATPWHHDIAYYPLNGTQIANCWTALDSIPVDTAVRFVRGSHHGKETKRATHFNPDKEYQNLMMERPITPDFDSMAERGECEIVACSMEPGDTVVFNCRTFHSAPGNHLPSRRAAFSTNWVGDDVTYNDIPQETDPKTRGEDLIHGAAIECATFPRVR